MLTLSFSVMQVFEKYDCKYMYVLKPREKAELRQILQEIYKVLMWERTSEVEHYEHSVLQLVFT